MIGIDNAEEEALNAEEEALVAVLLTNALRGATLHAKIDANELTTVGVALRNGWISSTCAIEWLGELGLCGLVAAVVDDVEAAGDTGIAA